MTSAIAIKGLSKKYILRHVRQAPYVALRDVLSASIRNAGRRLLGRDQSELSAEANREEFWALHDVSLDIEEGERVGVIGRNGAGKSTLLKLLSRITSPTSGRIRIRGRVASLLEVGTGFHPELTGRENIFLNGAILGMKKAEITRRFDDIVAFADVEKFLDTPVKRYSSGMYMRLAFAVAAHLEPEILIVDEVLAVGDSAFQKKCIGKMSEISAGGRTVLFVSHNMQAIRSLCTRGVLLEKGTLVADGDIVDVTAKYASAAKSMSISENTEIHNPSVRRGTGSVRFTSLRVFDEQGFDTNSFHVGDTIHFLFTYKVNRKLDGLAIYIGLRSGVTGEVITSIQHVVSLKEVRPGETGSIHVTLPEIILRPGEYPLYLMISDALSSPSNYDVIDGLWSPLVVSLRPEEPSGCLEVSRLTGYFSIPSIASLEK